MTAQPPREALPDTLRGLALLAVLVVNAIGYTVAPWGPSLGLRTPPDSAWAAIVQGLVAALLQGKGYTVLAFVFGMSLWLATRRRSPAEALQRGVARQRRLLGMGILHGVFIYFGDILTLYALVGRRLLGRLHMPWKALRRHLWHALAWALLAKLVMLAAILGFADAASDGDRSSLASVQGIWPFLQLNAGFYLVAQVVALIVAGPVMYLCMVGGVVAARLRLLTHRRWRDPLRRQLLRWSPPLLTATLVVGMGHAMVDPDNPLFPWVEALGDLLSLPVAAVYVIGLALASSGGRAAWCQWFVPLGRRTLTLYLGHGLIGLLLFSGAGLALAPTTVEMVLFSLALWLLALQAARLSGRRRWPMEALMARR